MNARAMPTFFAAPSLRGFLTTIHTLNRLAHFVSPRASTCKWRPFVTDERKRWGSARRSRDGVVMVFMH